MVGVCVHFGYHRWSELAAFSTTELEMVFSIFLISMNYINYHTCKDIKAGIDCSFH